MADYDSFFFQRTRRRNVHSFHLAWLEKSGTQSPACQPAEAQFVSCSVFRSFAFPPPKAYNPSHQCVFLPPPRLSLRSFDRSIPPPRMPYFSYLSMLFLFETLGWWSGGAEVRKVHFAEVCTYFEVCGRLLLLVTGLCHLCASFC